MRIRPTLSCWRTYIWSCCISFLKTKQGMLTNYIIIFSWSCPTKKDDPHDHVGHEGAGPEDHVQRHRDVEVQRVVVRYTHWTENIISTGTNKKEKTTRQYCGFGYRPGSVLPNPIWYQYPVWLYRDWLTKTAPLPTTLPKKYMTTRVNQAEYGTEGVRVPHLVVNRNPSIAMTRN